jgi:hypothetical protein
MKKPIMMILGSYHMANPGADVVNMQADDVLQPKRQTEIAALVALLLQFRPTKVALEVDADKESELQTKYKAYLNDDLQLGRNEREQIGFRLANEMEHPKIYAVDWNKIPPVGPDSLDYLAFAKANNQQYLLDKAFAIAQKQADEAEKILARQTIIDVFRFINQADQIEQSHQLYFTIARIGQRNQYPGADWVQYWYGRNLKVFVNLTRITEPDDRILVLFGAGHCKLLHQFVEESDFYQLESPLRYLR